MRTVQSDYRYPLWWKKRRMIYIAGAAVLVLVPLLLLWGVFYSRGLDAILQNPGMQIPVRGLWIALWTAAMSALFLIILPMWAVDRLIRRFIQEGKLVPATLQSVQTRRSFNIGRQRISCLAVVEGEKAPIRLYPCPEDLEEAPHATHIMLLEVSGKSYPLWFSRLMQTLCPEIARGERSFYLHEKALSAST